MSLVFTMINYVINDRRCYYNYGYCYYCSRSVVLPILNCHFKSCWTQAECDLFQISFRSFNVRIKRGEKSGYYNRTGWSWDIFSLSTFQKQIKNYLWTVMVLWVFCNKAAYISIRHFRSSFNNDNGNDIYNDNDIV